FPYNLSQSRTICFVWCVEFVYDRKGQISGMTVSNNKQMLERGAGSDLWRNTLSQIPSVFGRLVYISALRNGNTGRYEHHGLTLVFGADEANRALRKSHSQAFAEWLSFDIEQQKADLDLYLSAIFEEKATVLEVWLRLAPYRNLMPNSVKSVE